MAGQSCIRWYYIFLTLIVGLECKFVLQEERVGILCGQR